MSSNEVKKKYRNWTFIVYPDSAREDWKSVLQSFMLETAISPCHDKDINEDGTPKKPHYHVLIMFNGPVTFDYVTKMLEQLAQEGKHMPLVKECKSVKGLIKYMKHEHNPEKYQYQGDIECLNGFDIADYNKTTVTDRKKATREMIIFIKEYDVIEFEDLVNYALVKNELWLDVLTQSETLFFTRYLNSKRNKLSVENIKKNGSRLKIDFEKWTVIDTLTGEIL